MTLLIGMEHNKRRIFAEPGFSKVVKSNVANQELPKKKPEQQPGKHFLCWQTNWPG
jgi:hypothetical protein